LFPHQRLPHPAPHPIKKASFVTGFAVPRNGMRIALYLAD
jgi:hypothetical protein